MNLRGQQGYAMAVLLVTLAVMAIAMTVAMPVWKHTAQREKETELVFRGQQYVHAIALFQRKHGPGVLPPNIDALLAEHYLRKKFKDPITNDDFLVLTQGATPTAPGTGTGTATTPGATTGGSGFSTPSAQPTTPAGPPGQPPRGPAPSQSIGGGGRGFGMIGVVSKSTAESIRIYNGRTHYNEWGFIYTPTVQAPAGVPTQPGQRQGGPGQRTGGPGQPTIGPATPFSPFGPSTGTPPGGRGRGRGF